MDDILLRVHYIFEYLGRATFYHLHDEMEHMPDQFESILLNPPKEVDVVAIERELAHLWKQVGETGEGEEFAPVIRACSLNLIVVIPDRNDLDRLGNLIGDVTVNHPARTFLIATDREARTPMIDAWISARCSLPVPGGKQVCCEQINLVAEGAELSKVPSIVTSLLVPDVPSVLLWKDAVRSDDELFESLANVMDRVLMDSAHEKSPSHALLLWEKHIRAKEGRASYSDLAWTHLTSIRNMLAHVFQPRDVRAKILEIAGLSITYSTTSAPFHSGLSQAFLLVAWLAHRLQWVPIHPFSTMGNKLQGKHRYEEQAINVEIQPAESSAATGGVIEVMLRLGTGEEIKLEATDTPRCFRCTVGVGASRHEEMLTTGDDQSDAYILERELEVLQTDKLYEAVLHKAILLLEGPSR